ncbi:MULTISPECIES: manganese efflux pump MntP [Curtobacterium]|uniref:manganese efflux pump MntP n=1 Tax=Curtobacterium TaxID=2034 RepID=UPI001C8D9662|nr:MULTISPECIES: manganese efflux pump MntP family protein [Curtobacterium]MBY0178322.1 manganese efflux pump [Curtobacterium herbarum]MCP1502826.1 putative Mn2+ efflux pump MntP [Curtobacterium herbarum]MDN3479475.1 manganese efflux pump MntP family protein [Curtobacterium sp. APC 4022]MDY1004594.1 manganese efflux pump MntP family protein [Curtobacterium sp. CFBP9011]
MSFWALFLIALGVSADAFAVALGKGLHMKRFNVRQAVVISVVFGLFQALMPLLGWLLGTTFARSIAAYDHWVAFGLLALVGGKMLWEAFRGHEDTDEDTDRLRIRELLVLAIATSIDALAVGVTLAFLPVSIGWAVLLIGITTAVLSFVGVAVGRRVGARFGKPAEIAGGVVLILIGVQVVLEHTGVLG